MKTYITELNWVVENLEELEGLVKADDRLYILAPKESHMPVSIFPVLSSLAASPQILFTEGTLDFKMGFTLGVTCLGCGTELYLLVDETSQLHTLEDILLKSGDDTFYQFKAVEQKKPKNTKKAKAKSAEQSPEGRNVTSPEPATDHVPAPVPVKATGAKEKQSPAQSSSTAPLTANIKFKQILSKLQSQTNCRPSLVINADKIYSAIVNSVDNYMSLDNALQRQFGRDSQPIYDAVANSYNELKAVVSNS